VRLGPDNVTAAAPQRRSLFALLVADAVSITGNMLTHVAIPWFVLQTTGSAAKTGITAFFGFLPVVLAGFFGGTVVDRLGFKRASIFADLASGVTVALIPLLHATSGLEFWQLLVLVFAGALFDAPGETARRALAPNAAGEAGWSLERTGGAVAAIERGARLAGAPLAGVLIASIGATSVLWIDAVSFGISALVIGLAAPALMPRPRSRGRYVGELKEGWSFLRADKLLMMLAVMVMVMNFLDAAAFSVVLPVYAQRVYSSAVGLGLMIGALGGGSVAGALAFAAVGHRLSRRKVFIWCFMGVALWYPVLAARPALPVAVAALAVAGMCAGPLNPILSTLEYERVPEEIRGRVFGVMNATAWMAVPLGVLAGGFALEISRLVPTLLVLGGSYVVATASLHFNSTLQAMDLRLRPEEIHESPLAPSQ
jgi:MFS family permease